MTKLADLFKVVKETGAVYNKAVKEALTEYRIQINLWHQQFRKTPNIICGVDEFLGISIEDLEYLIDVSFQRNNELQDEETI